jgi:hypothetical protein
MCPEEKIPFPVYTFSQGLNRKKQFATELTEDNEKKQEGATDRNLTKGIL